MPRRRLIWAATALIICLGIAADLGWRAYTRPRFAVLVDGNLLGAIREPAEAEGVLDALLAQITPEMQVYVNLTEKMTVRPLDSAERPPITTQAEIKGALLRTIPALADGMAILVNGQEIVVVADQQAAQSVRQQILDEYRATVLRDVAAVEQVKFQETIDWRSKLVRQEEVRTVEEAINILKHGTDKLVTYVVKSGDTGWDIARSYNLTTEQLAQANPEANLDVLQIGQVLNVTFKEPYVHTQSVAKRVVPEGIPFTEQIVKDSNLWPWQYQVVTPGVWGARELTIREYRENGRIVRTEVLENEVLKDPKMQVVKQGTRQIPDMGTGSLVYPVVGVTTSHFGPRWGSYHSGIDIGAPTGTPVLAADSGMVVFRGWSGNYGYLIKVDHGNGRIVTWYAHLSRFGVALGDTVQKGEVIGYVGNTGYSTGPHLHYEVHVDGEATDPLSFYR